MDQVSVIKGTNVYDQLKTATDLLGGMKKFVASGQRVMLKVNVTGPAPAGMGVTTNPLFVEAVVRLVCECGGKPIIADGTASATIGTKKVFSLSGYDYIAEHYPDVEYMDLNLDQVRQVKVAKPYALDYIKVANSVYEGFDVVINLPVMKTHFLTGVSLSLKNLKGVIPPAEKRRFHDVGVHKCVADLASIVTPDLILVDGTVGSEGLGPKEGNPVPLGVVVAGTHMVTTDAACCYIMGFDPHNFEHIMYSQQRVGGCIERGEIKVVGNSIEDVAYPFRPASPEIPDDGKITFINGNPCSGCIGAATIAASRLFESGILDWLNQQNIYPTFAIGPKFDKNQVWPDRKNLFFLGNCAKKAAENRGEFFPGCAPASIHITQMLADYYGFSHENLENGSERSSGKINHE